MTTIAGLIPYFTGQRIVAVKVTGLTRNPTTGVFTKGTTFNLASNTILSDEAVTFTNQIDNEEISAANASMRNHEAIKGDFDVEVREIKSANGGSITLGTSFAYTYFLVEVLTSDGTNQQLVQAPCILVSLDDEYAEGKSVNVLRGTSCGLPVEVISAAGTPTPVY